MCIDDDRADNTAEKGHRSSLGRSRRPLRPMRAPWIGEGAADRFEAIGRVLRRFSGELDISTALAARPSD